MKVESLLTLMQWKERISQEWTTIYHGL